ncbi:MAG: hypothetical protein CMN28_01435 [Salinisphaeraceae bacterium]|nr:hypothetical protein [Salinisphaeraceae bacterium]
MGSRVSYIADKLAGKASSRADKSIDMNESSTQKQHLPPGYARPMKPSGLAGARRAGPSGKAGLIAAELEYRLTTGKYGFGEDISSSELAEEFGASRHPVAVALNYLNTRGYIDVLPQIGYRVVAPTRTEIADMFLGLARIEALIASLASQRQTPEEGELLVRIAEQNRYAGLGAAAENEHYIACIGDFHQQLRYMARSAVISDASASWNRLSSFYLWQGLPEVLPKTTDTLNAERVEIAHAVASGQTDRAQQIMEAHIVHKPYLTGILD